MSFLVLFAKAFFWSSLVFVGPTEMKLPRMMAAVSAAVEARAKSKNSLTANGTLRKPVRWANEIRHFKRLCHHYQHHCWCRHHQRKVCSTYSQRKRAKERERERVSDLQSPYHAPVRAPCRKFARRRSSPKESFREQCPHIQRNVLTPRSHPVNSKEGRGPPEEFFNSRCRIPTPEKASTVSSAGGGAGAPVGDLRRSLKESGVRGRPMVVAGIGAAFQEEMVGGKYFRGFQRRGGGAGEKNLVEPVYPLLLSGEMAG